MSAESSKKLAKLAAAMLDDPSPAVRSLAGSVLRQARQNEEGPSLRAEARFLGRSADFWDGYWAGLWDCQQ